MQMRCKSDCVDDARKYASYVTRSDLQSAAVPQHTGPSTAFTSLLLALSVLIQNCGRRKDVIYNVDHALQSAKTATRPTKPRRARPTVSCSLMAMGRYRFKYRRISEWRMHCTVWQISVYWRLIAISTLNTVQSKLIPCIRWFALM